MLRVFILAVLATGASAQFLDDLDARVNRGLHDAVDDLQEGGLPVAFANLAHSLIPDNPAPASSDLIGEAEADEADEADEDEAEEDTENGVCDKDDENSCGFEEDPDNPDYEEDLDDVEYEEAEEAEEFDEGEFFEKDDGGDDEEEEGDDSGDGANGDGTYDPRSESKQLKDPMFDHERFKWIGHRGYQSSSAFKFNLRERLSMTDKLLYCKSYGTTNKQVAFSIAADQGHALRSELTHRDSLGDAFQRGSRHWPRGQTHGETVIALNLKLGIKRVFDEQINLTEGWSSYPFDIRILGRYKDFGMLEQDLESLELRPGPILKCVWATGLKSYKLADDLAFSMDVASNGFTGAIEHETLRGTLNRCRRHRSTAGCRRRRGRPTLAANANGRKGRRAWVPNVML